MSKVTQQQLEAMLWGAATVLRGRTAGQDYKGYILSLLFFKRLCDQWKHEADAVVAQKEAERGKPFTEAQRKALLAQGVHRFTIPAKCDWDEVLDHASEIGAALDFAMQGIAQANRELTGVFTVSWNLPAPDGQGKLIENKVVHELVQSFNDIDLSNASVSADMLGRAYEYLIKMFADDAGAKAGEFFTPPEVVECLVRIVEPQPDETVYDPTCGSGGMLVHAHDFLKEQGKKSSLMVRYYGQEMVWSTYAIAKINVLLHGMEADIRGGKSTITDPQHTNSDGSIRRFNVVLANFPFSDEMWWLSEDARAAEESRKAQEKQAAKKGGKKAKKASRDDFTDKHDRFTFGMPPAGYGDYAFIQHIVASLLDGGRAGVVCPQGVLFRGQPEIEEETGEFDEDGKPKVRRRKADDEYLIRRGLLDARLIDAVVALPLNVFYGAGLPACLLILNKNRPESRREKVLLVYAAREFRETMSNKNQLRPQDVMRILVHYHAYGDAARAGRLVEQHGARLRDVVTADAADETARINAEFDSDAASAASLGQELILTRARRDEVRERRLAKAMEKPAARLRQRDERVAECQRRAEEDRQAIEVVGHELVAMYGNAAELAKYARVVDSAEIEENEFNLNIPRYVDTFEPEEPIELAEALATLADAETTRHAAEEQMLRLLSRIGVRESSESC